MLVNLSVLSNILVTLTTVMNIYLYFMIIMIILSWIPGIYETGWYQKLSKISDFYIGRFRGVIVIGRIDFTPIIGFILYEAALQLLVLYIIPAVI